VERAIVDVEEHPRRWPVLAKQVRKRAVGRFPYSILYRVDGEAILIVAVMHMHRHPHYWTNRLR
jgi:toxin ParE1/3/4